ncbi:hypothetical protein B6U84_03485 [Candidatus Bathyarchaeota archaeon ex4484_40]|nr:MAG: hypothetical protein B6U84_03485 [Candidatus Bathyarchaeota archaeon ex4484_40]
MPTTPSDYQNRLFIGRTNPERESKEDEKPEVAENNLPHAQAFEAEIRMKSDKIYIDQSFASDDLCDAGSAQTVGLHAEQIRPPRQIQKLNI